MECFKREIFQIKKPLIPLKLLLFTFPAGVMIIQTYLNIYLEDIGLSFTQITILNIIVPICQFIGVSICGMIADKTGKPKCVLYVNVIAAIVFATGISFLRYITNDVIQKPFNCTQILEAHDSTFNDTSISGKNFERCSLNTTYSMLVLSKYDTFYNDSICLAGMVNRSISQNDRFYCIFLVEEDTDASMNNVTERTCECYPSNSILDVGEDKDNHSTLLISAIMLSIGYKVCHLNTHFIMDATSASMSEAHGSHYGMQRVFMVLGYAVLVPLSGYIVQSAASETSKNYYTVFIIFDVLGLVSLISIWQLEVKLKPRVHNFFLNIYNLLKGFNFLTLFFVVFFLSVSWGFKFEYVTLYLKNLEGSSFLLSLIQMANNLTALPFLFTSYWWVRKVGSQGLLVISFIAYALYYLGYSYLVDPWLCLLYETLSTFYHHLMWVSVVHRNNEITPEPIRTTTLTLLGGLHFGLGSTLGSVVGGVVMDEYGGRTACRVLSTLSLTCGALYACIVWGRRKWISIHEKYEVEIAHQEKEKKMTEIKVSAISCDIETKL